MTETRSESRKRHLAGALAGLLAGAAGITAAEAVSALLTGVTSPLLAVANRAVDETPRWLKEFAIETFGARQRRDPFDDPDLPRGPRPDDPRRDRRPDLTTVQGDELEITGEGDNLKSQDATVVCGGVQTANATVYLIDSAMMPPSMA
ncbi:MAG TPA: fasciclin domain-containing protein [Nocardioidaceae bacterium]|nr:fasciclin domain-containing protein [Nocardioidaceae bacterium]